MIVRGSVVVVTGASSGIGEATSVRFAAGGARVVLAARRLDRLEAVAERIRANGGEAVAVRCDVTVREDLEGLARAALERFGRVDVVVANAGVPGGGPFRGLDAETIERVVGANLLGVMHTVRVFLPSMLERGSGHVVVVASLAGRFATPGISVYAATKHGAVAFAESLAHELRPLGVLVTSVNPGFTETEGFPQAHLPRFAVMSADRVARTIVDVVRRAGPPEVAIPRWISPFQAFRVLTPPLYRWGIRVGTAIAGRGIRAP